MSRRSRIFRACLVRATPRGNTNNTTKSNAVTAWYLRAETACLHVHPAVILPPCVVDAVGRCSGVLGGVLEGEVLEGEIGSVHD
jgi:hypothetical protein